MKRAAIAALAIVSGCTFLFPVDEFLTDGPGGAAGSTSSSGGAPSGGGGGGSAPGCTPERETNPYNCGEEGYECEEGICTSCMCDPHSMGDFLVDGLLYDFVFGKNMLDDDVVVATLAIPTSAIDVLEVLPDSWSLGSNYVLPTKLSERLFADPAGYFFAADGIYYRGYDQDNSEASTLVCNPMRPSADTFDHLARAGSHVYRSLYYGSLATGRIDRCAVLRVFPPDTLQNGTTSHVWEIIGATDTIYWSNRTPGGGVYRILSTDFTSGTPDTLYSAFDGVPTALAYVDGRLYLADCTLREVHVVPPGGETAMPAFATLNHVAFFEAVKETDNSVTIYAVETADPNLCTAPLPAIYDGSLVRYRAGEARVLAAGIRLPTTVRVHDGYVYYSRHPAMRPEVVRVPL